MIGCHQEFSSSRNGGLSLSGLVRYSDMLKLIDLKLESACRVSAPPRNSIERKLSKEFHLPQDQNTLLILIVDEFTVGDVSMSIVLRGNTTMYTLRRTAVHSVAK